MNLSVAEEFVAAAKSDSPDELSRIVATITSAFDAGDYARTGRLIADDMLATWFGFDQPALSKMLGDLLDTDGEHNAIIAGLNVFMSAASGARFEAPEVVRALILEGSEQTQLMLHMLSMFDERLQGHPVRALERTQALNAKATKLQPLFDTRGGWALFAAVQHGLTAMLAGDFAQALRHFAGARLHVHVPSLEFLHRDAYVRAALVHACYGDQAEAEALLAQADRLPRTSSWAESGIDASAALARALLESTPVPEAVTLLTQVDLREVGEMWPFYAVVIARVLNRAGQGAEVGSRLELLDSLPLPRADGEGFSGSVLPLIRARVALREGDVELVAELLLRADPALPLTRLVAAKYHVLRGEPQQAMEVALGIEAGTRWLSGLEAERRSILAQATEQLRSSHDAPDPERSAPPAAPVVELTRQESQVLRLLGSGASQERVADALFLSRAAVAEFTGAIVQNYGAASIADAIRIARDRGEL